MQGEPQLLDIVALMEDLPDIGVCRGQVGTIVEVLPPDGYEVEFSRRDGTVIAELGFAREQFMILNFDAAVPTRA